MTMRHVSPVSWALETETSDVSKTPTVIFRRLDASNVVMTLDAIPLHHEGSSSGQPQPQPRPQQGWSFVT
jgi:hypothetical protein